MYETMQKRARPRTTGRSIRNLPLGLDMTAESRRIMLPGLM
jgi:hypothetical protein